MTFTAVIVLHDSEPELRALLDSLERHLAAPPQLVVVDSGSSDGGAALARERGAEVIELPDNPGLRRRQQRRARPRPPRRHRPAQPRLRADRRLARRARRARPRAPGALHAPRLLNADGSVQRSAHPLPGTPGAAARRARPPAAAAAPACASAPSRYRASRPRTVGWAIAACLAAHTGTLRRLGPFDPAVHLFAEDMELCLRARAAGIPTVLHPELRLRHAGGHATLREGEPYELLARRRREAVGSTLGPRAQALDDLAQAVTFATRTAGHAVLGGDAARPRAQLDALRRARRHD